MIQRKVALVTGVSSGIGQATAARLLERGFRTFGTLLETSADTGFPSTHHVDLALLIRRSVGSETEDELLQATFQTN